jgi:outer membrane protein
MKIRVMPLIAILCFCLLGGKVYGAEVQKIGVIDFQEIFSKSNPGKLLIDEIKSRGKKMEETLKEKGAEIEELRKALDQKALVLSDDAREEKEQELGAKFNDLKSLQKRYTDVLRDLEINSVKRVRKDVLEIVQEIGREAGYSLIIDRRGGGVVYAPKAIDITGKVIEKYNALDARRGKEDKSTPGPEKKE